MTFVRQSAPRLDEDSISERPNLLLFGCDFKPARQTSELVFWQDSVEHLRQYFDEVVVVSINNRAVPEEQLFPGVTLYNLPPCYPRNRRESADPEYTGKRFHKLPLSIPYKTVTLFKHRRLIEHVIKKHRIGIVHYMRIFGILNEALTRRHPRHVFTMTVPTHIDRGFPLHQIYHLLRKLGFTGMDKLVPTSQATARKLKVLGIPENKMAVIPWSIRARGPDEPVDKDCESLRKLGIARDKVLVLWSGPLQHTGRDEFVYGLQVAKSTASRCDRYHFVFAFKPDGLNPEFVRLVEDDTTVTVVETDRGEFDELQARSGLFLSPVCNTNRTVAPPLTWIEMMQKGTPVLTTRIDGVTELIEHGQSGFVVDTVDGAVRLLCELDESELQKVGHRAAQVIRQRYCLKNIAESYVDLWRSTQREKQMDAVAICAG